MGKSWRRDFTKGLWETFGGEGHAYHVDYDADFWMLQYVKIYQNMYFKYMQFFAHQLYLNKTAL